MESKDEDVESMSANEKDAVIAKQKDQISRMVWALTDIRQMSMPVLVREQRVETRQYIEAVLGMAEKALRAYFSEDK
jgi:hypothetical protein